jgi:AraC-like DNA-binding protein/CheY-like chemotaxis protein
MVRESVILKVNEIVPQSQVFDAGFGYSALEKIKLIRPDVIIMDIRMPEIDGLKMLQLLKDEQSDSHIIIISGYDEFRYAQKAIQFGVMDYLLKPIDQEKLRSLFDQLMREKQHLIQVELENKLNNVTEIDHFTITHFGHIGLLADDQIKKCIVIEGENKNGFSSIDESLILRFCFCRRYYGSILPAEGVHAGSKYTLYSQEELFEVLKKSIEDWEIRCFFERSPQGSAHMRKSSEEGKRAANWRQQIVIAAKNLDYSALEKPFAAWLDSIGRFPLNDLRNECALLMASLDEGLSGKKELIWINEEKIDYWRSWIKKSKTWRELQNQLKKFVLGGILNLNRLKRQDDGDWIERAMGIMRCKVDSSLESVAAELNIHPVTLSRLFKQKTGINFIDFLTEQRLLKAKKLLTTSDKKIFEVAELTGYQDSRYFAAQFKKKFGETPIHYRKNPES